MAVLDTVEKVVYALRERQTSADTLIMHPDTWKEMNNEIRFHVESLEKAPYAGRILLVKMPHRRIKITYAGVVFSILLNYEIAPGDVEALEKRVFASPSLNNALDFY